MEHAELWAGRPATNKEIAQKYAHVALASESEDIGEAYIALHECIDTFDTSYGIPFEAYASGAIKRAKMISAIKRLRDKGVTRYAQKAQEEADNIFKQTGDMTRPTVGGIKPMVSVDSKNDDGKSLRDAIPGQVGINAQSLVLEDMDEEQKEVYRLLVEGINLEQISLCLSRPAVEVQKIVDSIYKIVSGNDFKPLLNFEHIRNCESGGSDPVKIREFIQSDLYALVPKIWQDVLSLAADGYNHSRISSMTGVPPTTVWKIASRSSKAVTDNEERNKLTDWYHERNRRAEEKKKAYWKPIVAKRRLAWDKKNASRTDKTLPTPEEMKKYIANLSWIEMVEKSGWSLGVLKRLVILYKLNSHRCKYKDKVKKRRNQTKGSPCSKVDLPTKEELAADLSTMQWRDIVEKYKSSYKTLVKLMKKYGLEEIRKEYDFKRTKTKEGFPVPSKESIVEDMKTMSLVAIGKKYGFDDCTIRKWLDDWGIFERAAIYNKKQIPPKEHIEADVQSMNYAAMGEKYAVHPSTIQKWVKHYSLVSPRTKNPVTIPMQ